MTKSSKARSKTGDRFRLAILVALLTVIGYMAWLYFRPPELVRGANRMLHAMQTGETGGLFESASSMEVQCCSLTPEKLKEAWDVLIGPRLAQSDLIAHEPSTKVENETQASASATYQDRNTREKWGFTIIANQTDDGPKNLMLFHMMFSAESPRSEKLDGAERMLVMVQELRPKLEKIGIQKIMLNPSNCATWDQLEEQFRKRMELAERRKRERANADTPK